MIDWNDGKSQVSKYFTVRECLYLPQWNRNATEADGLNDIIKGNIVITAIRLDAVRDFLGASMVVHCFYRPPKYNELVHGAKESAHTRGLAIDYHVTNISCDDVRAKLLPELERFNMRMEDAPGTAWVHCDYAPVTWSRFFKP